MLSTLQTRRPDIQAYFYFLEGDRDDTFENLSLHVSEAEHAKICEALQNGTSFKLSGNFPSESGSDMKKLTLYDARVKFYDEEEEQLIYVLTNAGRRKTIKVMLCDDIRFVYRRHFHLKEKIREWIEDGTIQIDDTTQSRLLRDFHAVSETHDRIYQRKKNFPNFGFVTHQLLRLQGHSGCFTTLPKSLQQRNRVRSSNLSSKLSSNLSSKIIMYEETWREICFWLGWQYQSL